MGAVGGLFGFGGGQSGSGVAAPASATLMGVTNPDEISAAYTGTQYGLNQQQSLLDALRQQNGIGNQTATYNQLMGVASGQGPNPAQAQYQQNIQNLAQQQAGALASAKGISPALQARLIAQQGSSAMQNAAGQGAANLANQQLGALGQAAGIAGQQTSNQIGQTNAGTQAHLAEQQAILGATGQMNATTAGQQASINSANAGLANTVMQGQQGVLGGVMNGIGAIFADGGEVPPVFSGSSSGPQSKFGQFLKGATNQQQDQSLEQQPMPTTGSGALQQGMGNLIKGIAGKKAPAQLDNISQSAIGDYTPGGSAIYSSPNFAPSLMNMPNNNAALLSQNYGSVLMNAPTNMGYSGGGRVPAMVSPGELYIPPGNVKKVANGANPMSVGAKIPGQPKVPGNSYANDTVPAKLDVGGIVIPNSIMQSKDPVKGAIDMIERIMAKRRGDK